MTKGTHSRGVDRRLSITIALLLLATILQTAAIAIGTTTTTVTTIDLDIVVDKVVIYDSAMRKCLWHSRLAEAGPFRAEWTLSL